ncbi:fimbrial assembly protein [Shewanella colwelliana]|uniref:Fimbrial assembly protein n=1 Tax=Shewanella colwelliana TaxID=23 RepID=A0A1E5IS56_SHECO|nr:PilN domain-containing protein [Shewanella colwelliana]OEG73384.1 fimbrial assembly protein [Shewanella colwelliana]
MSLKLRVNLYNASLLPPKLRLSFSRLLRVSVALLSLLLLANIFAYFSVSSLEQEKRDLVQIKNQLSSEKQVLEAEIATRTPSLALVKQVELLAQQIELKRLLLGELGTLKAITSKGYSALLTDLASVADSSIWLSRIQVIEERMRFEGYTSAPQHVPRWVEKLQQVDTLKGQAFSTLTMSRGEDKPLSFVLRSQETEEKSQ